MPRRGGREPLRRRDSRHRHHDPHVIAVPRGPRFLAARIGQAALAHEDHRDYRTAMRTNTTKAKLAEGKVVFGAIISRHAPDLVELFGAIGYDFVMIDCEHGPMSLDEVEHMVRAAEVFGITPITRIPNHEDSTILRFLDRGVQGIIVPHVNTAQVAEGVARAARYHPDGQRGMAAGGRAHDYGVGTTRDESTRWVNSQLLVIPMVEE